MALLLSVLDFQVSLTFFSAAPKSFASTPNVAHVPLHEEAARLNFSPGSKALASSDHQKPTWGRRCNSGCLICHGKEKPDPQRTPLDSQATDACPSSA